MTTVNNPQSNSNSNSKSAPAVELATAATKTPSSTIICGVCQAPFSSRNQLFTHLRVQHYADDAEFPATSPLDNLSPHERTAASVAIRGTYENKAHEAYYLAQVKAGAFGRDEWEAAQAMFKTPLPVAIRMLLPSSTSSTTSNINNNDNHLEVDIRYRFLQRLQDLVPTDALQACQAIPPQLAQEAATIPPRLWSPEAQRALMDAQDVGAVSRQELCSMIPPLLLLLDNNNKNSNDYQAGNGPLLLDNNHAGSGLSVLDLCAAPGSKSLQLLDMMHYMGSHKNSDGHNGNDKDDDDDKKKAASSSSNAKNNYMLVCNDANRIRLLTVARRTRRQPSHFRQSVLLNSSDGRYFPALRKWGGYKFKFSRVLADVPCSGDGTLRKLSGRDWLKWNVKSHLQIHRLQTRILTRALECVQKGGRVVYSTCSLDPIEDEAVLVSAIARMGGPSTYRIVPIPDTLDFGYGDGNTATASEFPYAKGATKWIVPHPEFGRAPKKARAKKSSDDDAAAATTEITSTKVASDGVVDGGAVADAEDTKILYETFASIDQVPYQLRKKGISPSMFPPHARTEALFRKAYDNDDYGDTADADADAEPDDVVVENEIDDNVNNNDNTIDNDNSKDDRDVKDNRKGDRGKKFKKNKDNDKEKKPYKPLTREEKREQAWRWGEILSPEDIVKFEEMLPNCGRIFPQHLNSGGFFCAVIERVAPSYYPVCYPLQRPPVETVVEGDEGSKGDNAQMITDTTACNAPQQEYKFHGRILHPVESARQVRDLIAKDKAKGDDVVFEGLATKELAVQWLKKHRCYMEGISEEPISLSGATSNNNNDGDAKNENVQVPNTTATDGNDESDKDGDDEVVQPKKRAKLYVNDPSKSAIYTPIFTPPHALLVAELCDFFGLQTDPEQAQQASVDIFPAHRLVVWIGSGEEEAVNVTTCVDPAEAHTMVPREDMADTEGKIARKRRFLQLALVSDEIKTLFNGGAKFSPMEVGLVLCWVPVPGLYREPHENDGKKKKKKNPKEQPVDSMGVHEPVRFEDASSRAVKSGKYGVLDEAAEFLGRCSTKRIVALTTKEALQLLSLSSLEVTRGSNPTQQEDFGDAAWLSRWGKQRLPDLQGWSAGAVIAVVRVPGTTRSSSSQDQSNLPANGYYSNIYLPCVLRGLTPESSPRLELLAEKRLTDAYKRLLQSI